jgi:hypothetical protein
MEPKAANVSRTPKENIKETIKAFLSEEIPPEVINPIIKEILARWQGDRRILKIPHPKEARNPKNAP